MLKRVHENVKKQNSLNLYNGHADVTALINATTGAMDATYYYDAFGNIMESTGNVDNNITYAGYQYDEETGLYYLNARMYDPKIARFLQEDTYSGDPNDPLSLNLYTYCLNNPMVYYDPTGHWPEWLDRLKASASQGFNYVGNKVYDGASYVGNKANDVWNSTTSTVSSGYNYVSNNIVQPAANWTNNNVVKPTVEWTNNNVVQPAVQTAIKTKETVEYVIENPPSSPKDVLAMGTGFTVTAIKNNIYDPLLVDLPTVVGAFTGVPNFMEYRQEMQRRGTVLENRVTNFFGFQDNEYYYAGGTIASTFDMAKGAVEVVGGGVIFTVGTGITGASVGGAPPSGGVSLVGTLAGVPTMALGFAVGGHGVSSAMSGYNSFNQNYNKFDEITGGINNGRLKDSRNIRYSQDDIGSKFSDGTSVNETIARLKADPKYAKNIEPVRLIKFKDLPTDVQKKLVSQGVGKHTVFTLDNRRLYAAKMSKTKVNSRWATLDEIQEFATTKRFTTNSGGLSIEVR